MKMYVFLGWAAVLGLAGTIVFGIWANVDKRNMTVSTLLVLSLFVMLVGTCGGILISEDTGKEQAREYIAQQLKVSKSEVIVGEALCNAPTKSSCLTWTAPFRAGKYSGVVIFNPQTAMIEKYWIGEELPPITGGALIFVRPEVAAVLFLVGLIAALLLSIRPLHYRFTMGQQAKR